VVTIYTIGHSNRELADFSRVLQAHEIRLLVDVRAFPVSRRYPHFNRSYLELWLPEIGTGYVWEKDLGGRRDAQMPPEQSPNPALTEPAFRNYADYMLSQPFQKAADRLAERAQKENTAIMCAEYSYLNCHRQLVSDYFLTLGHKVLHIGDDNEPTEHTLSESARIIDGQLVYRGDYLF